MLVAYLNLNLIAVSRSRTRGDGPDLHGNDANSTRDNTDCYLICATRKPVASQRNVNSSLTIMYTHCYFKVMS